MKKVLLVNTVVIACFSLRAQITITSADFPGSGDSVRVSYAASTGSVDHTQTGMGYYWDFSALTPIAQERIEFTAPTAFPFNFFSDFGIKNTTPDSLPVIGSIPSNFIDYYKNSTSSFRQIGTSFEYAPLGNFSVPIIYSSQDTLYRFPMNFGNADSCDAAYGFSIPGIGYLGQDRHRVNLVDGWGTLITPLDTFQVLRMRTVVNAIDTISLDTTSQTGFTIARPTEVKYKWFANGMTWPVLEVDCQVLFNTETVVNVIYQDRIHDSLFQVGVSNLENQSAFMEVYPNPAQEEIFVTIPGSRKEESRIRLVDITGNLLMEVS